MGKQRSMILCLIVVYLLFSTGYGDNYRTPTGIGSSSGGFNSEEDSRDAYAAVKSNRFPDSSSLRRSDRVDVDVDSDSIPEFNEPVGLQAEAQDGGRDDENSEEYVELSIPEPGTFLAEARMRRSSSVAHDVGSYGILSRSLAVSHSEVPGLESGSRRLSLSSGTLDRLWAFTDSEVPDLESGGSRWSTPGAGTSSQVARSSNQRLIELSFANLLGSITSGTSLAEVLRRRSSSVAHDVDTYGILSRLLAVSHSEVPGLESGSQRLLLSSGALDVVASGIWSRPWAVTDSEVPDLESGSPRGSTPGAGTSSQVERSSNQRLIELGIAILLGSITAAVSVGVGELSSRNRFILNCVLVISIVAFVSLAAAFMTLVSTPSTDTLTNQTANTILARLGFAASAFGFILVIAMCLPDNLLWVIVPALIALVFIFVKTSLDRRPRT